MVFVSEILLCMIDYQRYKGYLRMHIYYRGYTRIYGILYFERKHTPMGSVGQKIKLVFECNRWALSQTKVFETECKPTGIHP